MLYALMNADNKRMMRVTVPNRKHPAYGGDPALSPSTFENYEEALEAAEMLVSKRAGENGTEVNIAVCELHILSTVSAQVSLKMKVTKHDS